MRHKLHVDLAGQQHRENVVGIRRVTLRERLARIVLGKPTSYTIVVPGESVEQVTITERGHDDLMALANAVGVTVKDGERA